MKKDIQNIFEQQITEWLTNEMLRPHLTRTRNKTLAETSFDLLIRWYPQVALDGRDSYGLDIIGRLQNSMVSERARDLLIEICRDFQGTNAAELKLNLKRAVHFEHNSPVDVVKRKLLGLEQININTVKTILNDGYSIVLITRDEERLIRENRLGQIGEFHQRLDAIGARLLNESSKSDLIDVIQNRIALLNNRK
jgi:hypothetical protein